MNANITKRDTPLEDDRLTDPVVEPALPSYQSHKFVRAVQIKSIDVFTDYCTLHHSLAGIRPLVETLAWHNKHQPRPGGYYVEYEDGYTSYSPADAFESGYRIISSDEHLSFGTALELLEAGQRVARVGWNGVNMFIFLVKGSTFTVNRAPLLGIYSEGTVIDYQDHIDMRTASGSIVPWQPSQTDMSAKDWVIV